MGIETCIADTTQQDCNALRTPYNNAETATDETIQVTRTALTSKVNAYMVADSDKRLAINAMVACDGDTTCNNGDALATALANAEVVLAAKSLEQSDAVAANEVAEQASMLITSDESDPLTKLTELQGTINQDIQDKVAEVTIASNDFSDAAALVVTKESEKQNKVVEVADKEAERVAKDALVVSAEEDRVAKETLAADKKQERVAKAQEATTAFDAKTEEYKVAVAAKKVAQDAVTACDGETTCHNGDALATALANAEVVEAAKIQEERDAEAAKDVANDMDTIIESATDLTALYEYKTDAENDLTIASNDFSAASNDFSAAADLVVTKESEKQNKVVEVADKEAERVAKDALVVSAEEDRVAKETLAAGKTQERVAKAQEATTAFDAKTEEYKVAVAAKKVAQDAVTACDGETTC